MSFLPAHGECNFRHFSLNLLCLFPHHCLSAPLSVLRLWLSVLRSRPEVDCVHPEEAGIRVGGREPLLGLTEQIQSGGGGRGSAQSWILHSCGEGLFLQIMQLIVSVSPSQKRYHRTCVSVPGNC